MLYWDILFLEYCDTILISKFDIDKLTNCYDHCNENQKRQFPKQPV